jgi:hypothetical protein
MKGRTMTSTSIRAGRGAGQTIRSEARDAGSQVLRAASRQLLATAGNQVLKAAVDQAVGKVDQVAGRLDAVAAGDVRAPRSTPSRRPVKSPERGRVQRMTQLVRVKMGPAFSLVVHQAMRVLQLIQRLAQQLVAALARLLHRAGRGQVAESEPTAGRPHRRDRMTPNARARNERAGGHGTDDARSGPRAAGKPSAARPSRPRPQPTGGPRRVTSDRSAGSGRED